MSCGPTWPSRRADRSGAASRCCSRSRTSPTCTCAIRSRRPGSSSSTAGPIPIRRCADVVGEVGTYRAQDMLTAQVVDSCVRAVNAVERGPGRRRAARPRDRHRRQHRQRARQRARLVRDPARRRRGRSPDSGDRSRYEGVADDDAFDERFWHPETEKDDIPRTPLRLPEGAGAARRDPGAVHRGRARPSTGWRCTATTTSWCRAPSSATGSIGGRGGRRPQADRAARRHATSPRSAAARSGWRPRRPDAMRAARPGPDAIGDRRPGPPHHHPGRVRRRRTSAPPPVRPGTASPTRTASPGLAYYRYDRGRVTVLVMDTVDEFGGWQGSLDLDQFAWLRAELAAADAERRYVVLASHHPLETMVNPTEGPGGRRVLGDELADELARHPSVVLWLAGHTHEVSVAPGAGLLAGRRAVADRLAAAGPHRRAHPRRRPAADRRDDARPRRHRCPGTARSTRSTASPACRASWRPTTGSTCKYPLDDNPRSGPVDAAQRDPATR